MAFIDQTTKKKIAELVKPILKKYGLKGSLSVIHHSTLSLNIKSGGIDFIKNWNDVVEHLPSLYSFTPANDHISVNVYYFDKHFSGRALDALTELITAMNDGNWDRSDIQTDYFDVGWYVKVNIGRWDKPYILEA